MGSFCCLFVPSVHRKQKTTARPILFPNGNLPCHLVEEWSNMRRLILLKMYLPAQGPWVEIHLSPKLDKKNWISTKMSPVEKFEFLFRTESFVHFWPRPREKKTLLLPDKKEKATKTRGEYHTSQREHHSSFAAIRQQKTHKTKKILSTVKPTWAPTKSTSQMGQKMSVCPSRPLDAGGLLPREQLPFLDWCFVAHLRSALGWVVFVRLTAESEHSQHTVRRSAAWDTGS